MLRVCHAVPVRAVPAAKGKQGPPWVDFIMWDLWYAEFVMCSGVFCSQSGWAIAGPLVLQYPASWPSACSRVFVMERFHSTQVKGGLFLWTMLVPLSGG